MASPLENDKKLLSSIRGTSIPLRGGSHKADEDALVILRRKIAEECAKILQKEMDRLKALNATHPHAHHAEFAVQRLEELQKSLRNGVGADEQYKKLPAELRNI